MATMCIYFLYSKFRLTFLDTKILKNEYKEQSQTNFLVMDPIENRK